MNEPTNKPAFKTEKEIRDWYVRAEAGTLIPPMEPEDWQDLVEAYEIMCRRYPPKA